ncbi:MAG: IPT/TIG domain-containing protein [Acidimicrobiales bacterium]
MKVKRFEKARKVATSLLVALVAATLAFAVSEHVSAPSSPKFELTAANGFTITSTMKASYISPSSCTGPTTGPTADLSPGITRCLAVTVHNPLAVALKVTALSMVVASFTPSSTTPHLPACTTTMITPPTLSTYVPFTVTARGTHTINQPIALTTSGNQDNCKYGTFHFTYTGTATYTDSTTTTLTSTPNPSNSASQVTFTATVTAADANVNPTPLGGTVTFYACKTAGCTLITRALGTGAITTATGKATYKTSSLPVGMNYVEAKYTGTTKFATSTSSPVTQVILTARPTLTEVTPSAGKLVGGTVITLTGTHFRIGTTSVTFGAGNHGTTVHVTGTTTLTVKTPAHAAGTVTVTVTTPAGTSGAKPYSYDPVPTITSLSRTGPLSGYNTVTITGTGFTGATIVKFATLTAQSFTVRSSTQLLAYAPAHAAGTVRVSVTTPGGTTASTSADLYKYAYPVPAVTAITPASGPVTGGTVVTVSGSGFTGATGVYFGTTKVTTTISVNAKATQLTVKSPTGVSGTSVNVRVVTPGGESAVVSADLFTYGPTITSLSRTSGPVTGGTKVTITGAGFTTVHNVKFGTTTATSFTVKSTTQIIATSPAHAAGQVRISVTTAVGTTPATKYDLYTY